MNGLRNACAHRFSAYSREQGEELALDACITLVQRGPVTFSAHVVDELVSIEAIRGSPAMRSRCTCRIFALGIDGCRHLWAFVTWLDRRALIGDERITPGFDLIPRHPPSAHFWIGAGRVLEEPAPHRRRRG